MNDALCSWMVILHKKVILELVSKESYFLHTPFLYVFLAYSVSLRISCILRFSPYFLHTPFLSVFLAYSVSLRIKSECGKIRTRKTPYADPFHALLGTRFLRLARIAWPCVGNSINFPFSGKVSKLWIHLK